MNPYQLWVKLLNHGDCTRGDLRNADPTVFFPGNGNDGTAAKRICATCPVQPDCLEYALATNCRHGIWGGTSERERRKLRKARAGVGGQRIVDAWITEEGAA